MKRIGIFQFYSPYGFVEEYINELLRSMKSVLTKLIIICNGDITEIELQKLSLHTNTILKRKNEGYDAGAYKDIFLELEKTFWEQWDEIILFNCTFYGPFFSWKEIFLQMERKNIDFWGLSRHPGKKKMRRDGSIAPEHLQSYYLVVRKNMFTNVCFWKFWEELEYPKNYFEAIENFEWTFTAYFKKCGFKYTSWLDIQGYAPGLFDDLNPCLYPYELIKDYKFPIIKCKAMSLGNFDQMEKAINFVKQNTDYNIELITNHIKHLNSENKWKPFSINVLEKFINTHTNIYIFGNGKYGRGIEQYFLFRKWNFIAHVVSHPKHNNELAFKDLKLKKEDGLIVALGNIALQEMKYKLEEKFDKDQILFPDLN